MNTLKETLLNYKNEHKALPAFNIDSFEVFQAVTLAVQDTHLPCIVQLSAHEDKFIGAENLFMLVRKANLDSLPIYLNMDHGQDLARLEKLVRLGFDMVHFDGSSLPYVQNLSSATTFVKSIRALNPDIVVEVEFNKINLIEKGVDPSSYTDPTLAQEFMLTTGADLLASSIGNLHGVNTSLPENIDLARLQNIVSLLPDKLFTLHGGSGISPDQIKSAINLGIVKININTDLRLAFKKSLAESINTSTSEKVYDYLAPAVSTIADIIMQKLIDFSNPTL
ncbi:MAG: class II fructose-bisphosphate aldolase [Microgenomates group bacterium]